MAVVLGALLSTSTILVLLTPRVVAAIGEVVGFGKPWLTAWNLGKWPILAAIATFTAARVAAEHADG